MSEGNGSAHEPTRPDPRPLEVGLALKITQAGAVRNPDSLPVEQRAGVLAAAIGQLCQYLQLHPMAGGYAALEVIGKAVAPAQFAKAKNRSRIIVPQIDPASIPTADRLRNPEDHHA